MGRVTTKGLLQANKMQADTITALRAQLRQARAERDKLQRKAEKVSEDLWEALKRLEAERDAAIKRAEAAEALAEMRLRMGLWAWDIIKRMLEKVPALTAEAQGGAPLFGGFYAPAEALRAEHRSDRDRTPSTESPQSGQARQEEETL